MPPSFSQGSYISWFSGERLTGPQVVTRSFTLPEMAVYTREGSIIPMRTDDFCKLLPLCLTTPTYCLSYHTPTAPLGSAQEIPDKLKFVVFVGKATRYNYITMFIIIMNFVKLW